MNETYVDAARRGKNTWPRYLLGAVLILFFWQVLGLGLTFILVGAFGGSLNEPSWALEGPFQFYLAFNAIFLPFLVGIVLAVVLIHRRSPRTLVTLRGSINKKRIAQGFGLWFALLCASSLVGFILAPSSFSFGPDLAAFVPFALLALIITPIQTTSEELFFRGYLVQGASLISRSPIFLIPVSGVLFVLPHLLNPEAREGGIPAILLYLLLGLFLALISLKDGTIELAIGAHAANNLFGGVVFSYSGSVLGETPSLFYLADRGDPWFALVPILAISALFYLLVFVVHKRGQRS
jgi:uncharacterized protein